MTATRLAHCLADAALAAATSIANRIFPTTTPTLVSFVDLVDAFAATVDHCADHLDLVVVDHVIVVEFADAKR